MATNAPDTRVNVAAATRPAARLNNTRRSACPSISRKIAFGDAPRAIRTPISCGRRAPSTPSRTHQLPQASASSATPRPTSKQHVGAKSSHPRHLPVCEFRRGFPLQRVNRSVNAGRNPHQICLSGTMKIIANEGSCVSRTKIVGWTGPSRRSFRAKVLRR